MGSGVGQTILEALVQNLNKYLTLWVWYIGLAGLFWVMPETATAQRQVPPEVRDYLQERGVTEDEVTLKLAERGIDIYALSDQDIILLRPEIEAAVEELVTEKTANPLGGGGTGTARTSPQSSAAAVDSVPSVANGTEADALAQASLAELKVQDSLARVRAGQRAVTDRALRPIFGHDIFRNGGVGVFSASESVDAPSTYVIGTGDRIRVSIFGASQADFELTVDSEGFVQPGNLPKILVRGVTLGDARELFRRRLGQYYVFSSGQLTVSIDGSRTIRVNVFGEVSQSGTYSLSAINGALNALVAAGGPKRSGSVRNIRRSRGGASTTIDLYEYLTTSETGGLEENLQNNDVLFVPVAQNLVTLEGAVKRPMIYELREQEGVRALLEFAGGFRAGAYPELIQITRLIEGRQEIISIAYSDIAAGRDLELEDGDNVQVRTTETPQLVAVSVQGAVELPGSFTYRPGLTIADVLGNARLRENARLDVAVLRRQIADGTVVTSTFNVRDQVAAGASSIALERGDDIEVLSSELFSRRSSVAVTGAVGRQVADYPYSADSTLTVERALLLAGGRLPQAADRGVIFTRNADRSLAPAYRLVAFDRAGLAQSLRPQDSLVVYPREFFERPFVVTLQGAVGNPGNYPYDPSLGVRELITVAGGLTYGADTSAVEVIRVDLTTGETKTVSQRLTIEGDFRRAPTGLGEYTLQPFDVIVVRLLPEFELTQTVSILGEVRHSGTYAITEQQNRISDIVRAAGGPTNTAFLSGTVLYRRSGGIGFVLIDLDEILRNPKGPQNIVLLNGDEISLPKAQEVVVIKTFATRATEAVMDTLTSNGRFAVAFRGPLSAKRYVEEYAGGFAERAEKKSLTVRYANGELKRTRGFLGIRSYPTVRPGATISLNMKPPKKAKPVREPVDWVALTGALASALVAGLSYALILRTVR